MNRRIIELVAVGLVAVLVISAVAIYLFMNQATRIRIACVGDSLTQSSEYPYYLWNKLGNHTYDLRNFGAGSTTVILACETAYMTSVVYPEVLDYQPDIVIIMLGTNDAQPSLHQFNASLVGDYVALVDSIKALESKPEVWVVLPPPIVSNQSGKIDSAYFDSTIIPAIAEAARRTGVPVVDVHSAFLGHSDFYKDGVHINSKGAALVADTVYGAVFSRVG